MACDFSFRFQLGLPSPYSAWKKVTYLSASTTWAGNHVLKCKESHLLRHPSFIHKTHAHVLIENYISKLSLFTLNHKPPPPSPHITPKNKVLNSSTCLKQPPPKKTGRPSPFGKPPAPRALRRCLAGTMKSLVGRRTSLALWGCPWGEILGNMLEHLNHICPMDGNVYL